MTVVFDVTFVDILACILLRAGFHTRGTEFAGHLRFVVLVTLRHTLVAFVQPNRMIRASGAWVALPVVFGVAWLAADGIAHHRAHRDIRDGELAMHLR